MNTLQTYQFQSHQFRVIPSAQGEPWFIAKDVCDILGYANSRDAVKKSCRSVGVANSYVPGLSNTYTLIDEGNLYRLIIKSNKPESEPFESWVCDEVLPSVRKTGSYGVADETKRLVQSLQAEVLYANPRLNDVLSLIRAGYSQARIADMLRIAPSTVWRDSGRLRACGFVICADAARLPVQGGAQ
ncbi:BRO family protein [Methylobacter sp.]|uniref:BRO family protein n=1 Tax=Methylobacter sp. TaxID=2051955 RepID=UPI002FDE0E2B